MKKNHLFLTFIAVFAISAVQAQTQTLEGFTSISKAGISPIMDGHDVKGYTLFFKVDKADKKNDNYGLSFYDENLALVKTLDMKKPRNSVYLINNCYNGQAFGLFFYNVKNKALEIETYDRSLTKLGAKSIAEISKMDQMTIEQNIKKSAMGENAASMNLSLYAVENRGFLKNGILGMGKGFTLDMYDNSLKPLWSYQTSKDANDYEALFIYEITGDYVIGCLTRRPGMMSKKLSYSLVVFDAKTGKKIIDQSIEKGVKEQLSLSGISYEPTSKEFVVVGDFYKPDDKAGVSKSQGFFLKKIGIDGVEKSKMFYAWEREIKVRLPAEAKESVEKGFMNYPHRIFRDADGNIYLITEQFKTAVDGLGIAANVLAGGYGASMTKAVVGNIMLFKISPDLAIQEIKFFPKDPSTVTLPAGSDFYGPGIIAMFIKLMNDFDYQFSQASNDAKSFNVVYVNYDREKGESTKKIVGNIQMNNGTLSVDKMDVTSKATSSFLYPAKPGYIMMVDFLRKEKQLGLKLIKLNN